MSYRPTFCQLQLIALRLLAIPSLDYLMEYSQAITEATNRPQASSGRGGNNVVD